MKPLTELRQMKANEIADTREKILNDQGGKCAICDNYIMEDSGQSLDHQHMTSKEEIGEDGAGLIRGVLCRSCNCWEGKIWNNTGRYMQPFSVEDRIESLEALIDYYKKGTYNLIHPNEAPKESKVSKRNYNKLKKEFSIKSTKKFPEYPKSGKLTIGLRKLFAEYEIEPYN